MKFPTYSPTDGLDVPAKQNTNRPSRFGLAGLLFLFLIHPHAYSARLLRSCVQCLLRNLNAFHIVNAMHQHGHVHGFDGDRLRAPGGFHGLGHDGLHHGGHVHVIFHRQAAVLLHPNAEGQIAQVGQHGFCSH